MKTFIVFFIAMSVNVGIYAQAPSLSSIVKSMYCANISCFDSIMVSNGFKKTNQRNESNGKYTVYTEESYDSDKQPAPTVINYVVTTKKEIVVTITTYNNTYAKEMEYDLQLPSLKFINDFKEDEKECFLSDKHPKVVICITRAFSFDLIKNEMTVGIIMRP